MSLNFTLESFKSLPLDEKNNIIRYQNHWITDFVHLNDEGVIYTGDSKKMFQNYVNKFLDNLIYKTKCLKIIEDSWSESEASQIASNKNSSQSSFKAFFQGYASTLASIEMLKTFSNYDIFDHKDAAKKLELIKNTFDIEITNFMNFHIDEKKMKLYDLKILSLSEIQENAQNLIKQFDGLQIINFLDSKYRDYLRSRSRDFPYYYETSEQSFETFAHSIVDIQKFFNLSLFSQNNLISVIYSAYFDVYRVYRYTLESDNRFQTFESYKQSRIDGLKKAYIYLHEKKLLDEQIAKLDDAELLKTYNNHRKHYENKGAALQTFLNQIRKLLCEIFNNPYNNESIVFTIKDSSLVTCEFNGRKFYAFPDDSVKNVSSEAYFGFSLLNTDIELIKKFETMLSQGFVNIRSELEKSNPEIPSTNFYSRVSMLEEFNVNWVQKLFFNNEVEQSVEVLLN